MLEIHFPIYLRVQGISLGLEWMSDGVFEGQIILLTIRMHMEWSVLPSYSLEVVVPACGSVTTLQSRREILLTNNG